MQDSLSPDEINELRRIIARQKSHDQEAGEKAEKAADLRMRTKNILGGILRRCWALKAHREFCSIPKGTNDTVCDDAVAFAEALFGMNFEGLQQLYDRVDKIDDLSEQRLLLLKAEDIENELRRAFESIAAMAKSKGN